MMFRMNRWNSLCLRWASPLAALLFAVAVAGFGSALGGYSQAQHPVALLGANPLPHAPAFNALGFVLPGTLAACAALALRVLLPKPISWPLRLGAQLLLLAALAFAAMGVFPLQLDANAALDADASRLHGMAWMLWLVASALAALLLGLGWWRHERRLALASFAALLGLLLFSLLLPGTLPQGLSQRLAFALWWAWLVGLGWSLAG